MFEFLKRKKKKKSYEMQTVRMNDLLNFLGIDENSDRLQEVTYYTCLKVLSEGLSKLPLTLQRVSEDGGIIDMISSPLWQTAKVRPNPYMSPSTFWAVMENNRNHFGNGYAMILRDERSGSVTLWPMEPSCIRIEIEQGKDLSELKDITYVYTSPNNGQSFRLRSDEVLHVKTSTVFFGLVGLSVQDKLKMSLDGAAMSQEMLNKLYKNNFVPKAAVQFDTASMVNEDYESAYLRTLQNYADGKGEGGSSFIPLSPGTNIIPLNIKLTDGQFLELRKYTALQIAAAFGIKPNHLNDYERSSYANSETQQLAFYTDTMLYILKQYEEELNFKLLSQTQREQGYRFKFNIAAVLRGDTKSQLESLSMGVSNGVYTPNEARRNLDLPALPGGDRIYFNGSNIAVEDAGIQYREQEQDSSEKTLLRLTEAIEKAVECGIINITKYSDSQPRDDHGRWTDGGGDSGGSSGGGSLNENSKKPITKITDDAIEKIPLVSIAGYSDEQCAFIQQQHKELLRYSRDNNDNKEVAFVFRSDFSDRTEHKGSDDRLDLGTALNGKGKDLIIMHNYPRNSSYSMNDVVEFITNDNIKTLTIVKNNGRIETLTKINSCDKIKMITDLGRIKKKNVKTGSDKELDKTVKDFLTKNVKGGIFEWQN